MSKRVLVVCKKDVVDSVRQELVRRGFVLFVEPREGHGCHKGSLCLVVDSPTGNTDELKQIEGVDHVFDEFTHQLFEQ